MLIGPMRTLGIALGMAQRATASGARLFELLDRAPRLASPPGAPPLPRGRGRVELRDVSFAYEDARDRCCADVDLDGRRRARRSRWSARTGSGKTTLVVAARPRLYDVTGGAVLIDGADVRDGRPRLAAPRRSRVVTDDPFLFSATVARQHRLRAAGRHARGGRAGGRARAGGGLHRASCPTATTRVVGERGLTLSRRPAPADRDRARAAGRPAHPRPRRRHLVRRRLDRAGDQGRRCAR